MQVEIVIYETAPSLSAWPTKKHMIQVKPLGIGLAASVAPFGTLRGARGTFHIEARTTAQARETPHSYSGGVISKDNSELCA